ncbi:MAG: Mur ligase family protein, partial [bacterium]|nr:Mur ligase family protein [bacterium]
MAYNLRGKKVLALRNSKVLVFGLGLLGGGVATTNWLIKHGAQVTVTDLKDENYLEPSLRRLKGKLLRQAQGRLKLRLNGHDKKDIEDNEIIVFNPDVSIKNPFVKYAQKIGRQIENEATIFYKLCPQPIVAVTGTRGKTTTANWTGHFLAAEYKTVVSGNSYIEPLLKTLDSLDSCPANLFSNSRELENRRMVVNEIPSYHLEYFDKTI